MPEISRFFGIIIAMFGDDHNPPHHDELMANWAWPRKYSKKCLTKEH